MKMFVYTLRVVVVVVALLVVGLIKGMIFSFSQGEVGFGVLFLLLASSFSLAIWVVWEKLGVFDPLPPEE